MRYISEYRFLPNEPIDYLEKAKPYYKKDIALRIGEMIGECVGIEDIPNENKLRLEVEVFSSKDWADFKQQLKETIQANSQLGISTFNLIVIGKMIRHLESIGTEKINT